MELICIEGKGRLKKRLDRDKEKACDAMCTSALFFPGALQSSR